jgi:tRNA(fMet)-specific endonuclease VapC
MLDTNTVSYLLRDHPSVVSRVVSTPMAALCISAITAGELAFGLAKRPDAKRLRRAVEEFLKRVDILPWDTATARQYGPMRAELRSTGRNLAPLDSLIAAHAVSAGAVLVTSDRAFGAVPGLTTEDWS